jgi:hypothetical protein
LRRQSDARAIGAAAPVRPAKVLAEAQAVATRRPIGRPESRMAVLSRNIRVSING